jgi:hypothetical protein
LEPNNLHQPLFHFCSLHADSTFARSSIPLLKIPRQQKAQDVSDRAAWKPEARNLPSRDKGDLEPGVLARVKRAS